MRKSLKVQIRKRLRLTVGQKRQICIFQRDHPNLTQEKIAEIFTGVFEKPVIRSTVSKILVQRDRFINAPENYDDAAKLKSPVALKLSDEIFNAYCLKSSQGVKMKIKDVQELAISLSQQEKYGDYFKNHKFACSWIAKWKKAYGLWINLGQLWDFKIW